MPSESGDLRINVLGEFVASFGATTVDLGGRRQRAVLALLLLARGEVVPAGRLTDSLWGDTPPANAAGALQSYISHLRRRLEPGASARARAGVIVSEGPGYALRVTPDAVDAWRFEELMRAASAAAPAEAVGLLGRALQLWRGPAFADYIDEPWAAPESARLAELRAVAREQLLERRLRCGESAVLVPELEALVVEEPLREERSRLLVLALYRAGRQADALAALRRARALLADELGVDPGPGLRALEEEVLAQSPSLLVAADRAAPAPAGPVGDPPMTSVGVSAAVPRSATDDLVDRDRELLALAHALDVVAGGGSRVLLVEGPAGIGKSRLLSEARRLAAQASMRVLLARGSQLEKAFGFGMVRQLFEPVLIDPQHSDTLFSGAAASARGVFGSLDTDEPADRTFAVLHGLYWLSVNLAANGPLMLAVDDLQWCDSGSLRFLAYLARRLEGLPVFLVATIRTGEPHEDEVLLGELYDVALPPVRPAPLSREATAGLVRERLGEQAAASFIATCYRTTSGNPLLLRQLLRALEVEAVPPDASHADTVMAVGSRAVSSLVLMRLRRMPTDMTAVARAVAVLGDGAQLPTVASLAGLTESRAAAALAGLTRAEVVRGELPLDFVHPLVRDAVYRDLPPGERELQHQQAVSALRAAGAPHEQVAAHLLLTPRRGERETVELLRAAARTAADRGAIDSAVTYLRRALDEPVLGSQRIDVLLELGLLETLVDGPASTRHLEEAYPFLDDPAVRGEVAMGIARNHVFASERGVATAFARTARLSLPAELVDIRQGLLALERIAAFMHALDPADWEPGTTPEVIGRGDGAKMLSATLAWERVVQGVDRAGAVELGRAAAVADRLFDIDNGLLWVVAAISRTLADDDLGDFWQRAGARAHRRGSLFAALSTNLWRGYGEWRQGDLAEAIASICAANEQQQMWQQGRGIASAYGDAFLAGIHLDRGDVRAAREIIDGALSSPYAGDGSRLVAEAQVAVLVAEGRHAEALAATDSVVDPNGIINPAWRPWRSLRASALAGLGRTEEAVGLVEDELVLARRWGAPFTLGRTLRVLGELRGAPGLELLREAVAVLEPTPCALELAKARLALGRSLDVADSEAVTALNAALEVAHFSGAAGVRDDALTALAARGRQVEPPCDDVAVLTTTERRILDLTASGLDVRQVAERLFLTPGTVQSAVDALSARNRT